MSDADTTPEAAQAEAEVVAGAVPETDAVAGTAAAAEALSVEELVELLEATTAERDEYLDLARRTQAEFENYRKRVANQAADDISRATAGLVEQLLPVLDACDGAISHGAAEVEPIFAALLQTLEKQGLARVDPVGEAFDPNLHEAVMHEPAEDGDEGTVVSDVMRPGYSWKGLVVRPAMVKVRG
ncbi:MAG: nucleotide exchange factor GrpE [Acidimicrobiales bacterium]